MELIVITGMSGAGKSHALNKLEDMGYYCVDNFPLALMSAFSDMAAERGFQKAAMCIDCRDAASLAGLYDAICTLRDSGMSVRFLFLDASDKVLIKRYSETRRAHPMAGDSLVTEGIKRERELLRGLADRADNYIDTSDLKPAQLGAIIDGILCPGGEAPGVIIQSFGFKRGIPPESDIVFDVRFVPNPFWVEELRPYSGIDEPVRNYVMGFNEVREFVNDLTAMIIKLLPSYAREGKHRINIAIGCTGGRHRSVCVADALTKALTENKIKATLVHRDIHNDLQGK